MTKLCAEAMGYAVLGEYPDPRDYDPLHDDAQALQLVKASGMRIWKQYRDGVDNWATSIYTHGRGWVNGECINLNRAICEVVAKMQQAKK
jgi:hypothetical protein